MELATIGSRSRKRPKQYGKMGVSDTTLGRDSEENILRTQHRCFGVEDENKGVEQNNGLGQQDGIVRTQQLTIVYESSPEPRPKPALEVWEHV